MSFQEWKEKNPKAVKIIKIVAIVGTISICYVCHIKGVRIEITTQNFRDIRNADIGYSENLKNAALGIEARSLDASKTWARRAAIIAPYV